MPDDATRAALPASTPLPPAADEAFDRFAALVRAALDVPVALVSLVDATRQVFPGASGLPADVDATRTTPLSHSFCQHVVARSSPLIVPDARLDPLVRENLAVRDLAVVAYAGMPLTDASGRVIGSLCAIDHQPREWTAQQQRLLADLAAACSSELHVREYAQRATAAYERTGVLVDLAQALAGATTFADVSAAVAQLSAQRLGARFAAFTLLDESGERLTYQHADALPASAAEGFSVDAPTPSAIAVRTRRPQFYDTIADVQRRGPAAAPAVAELGANSLACVPLIVGSRVLGTLTLFWTQEGRPGADDRDVVLSLADYAAQAVHRAELLAGRRNAARILQEALLPTLPQAPGFELAGRYEPAHESDQVGGDWYDALVVPEGTGGTLVVSVGDVAGHDTAAAAVMGQVRSSLRTLLIDRPAEPHLLLERLDRVNAVESDRLVTAILASFAPTVDGAELTWSNAGHLPPVLIAPGEAPRLLASAPDPLLGLGQPFTRASHVAAIPRGSVVVLYTDGLVERRDESLSDSLAALLVAVQALRDRPLDGLLDGLLAGSLARGHDDDTAVFGIRVE